MSTFNKDEKPSERIDYALEALVKFENRKGCEVNMDEFHSYNSPNFSSDYKIDETCFACLGGAAAIQRVIDSELHDEKELIIDRDLIAHVTGDEEDTVMEYEASLDAARCGDIPNMFLWMGFPYLEGRPFNRYIADYHDYRDAFFEDMRKLSSELKAAGY